MFAFKITPILLLIVAVGAEKKIELQDIEEDNLKSEKQKDYENSEPRSQSSGQVSVPLDYLKQGLIRYYENPTIQPPQPTRYVHQYAVTEAPERAPTAAALASPRVQYGPVQQQQAMLGYMSNVPVQIYLVPQYYNEAEQGAATNSGAHHATGPHYSIGPQYQTSGAGATGIARVAGYQTAPEAVVPTQANYVEANYVPTYVPPTAKTYVSQQYSSPPVAYVSYNAQPTATPAPTIAPVLAYQVPVVQYSTPVAAAQTAPKAYYQNTHYQDTNGVEEVHQAADEDQKQYTHEVSYVKPQIDYNPRFYSARPPPREDYRHSHIPELPHPNPLLLKGAPPHLAHIPKALPVYRPLNKPVYNTHPGALVGRPSEAYGPPYKRRPTSLLDSYIPSSVQIEYMKRGFTNDPLQAYEALSSGRHLSHAPAPRHFERGFLPNQMYHTAGGAVTFGHYKRSAKIDKKASQN